MLFHALNRPGMGQQAIMPTMAEIAAMELSESELAHIVTHRRNIVATTIAGVVLGALSAGAMRTLVYKHI